MDRHHIFDDNFIYPHRQTVDSATIDTEHAGLKARGFIFQTNTGSGTEEIESSKALALERHNGAEVIVHSHAYDIYGRRLENNVSVWAKKKE